MMSYKYTILFNFTLSKPAAVSRHYSMHPKDISIADYRYELPLSSIADHPLSERDASKLLVYRQGQIEEEIYRNIGAHLPEGSLLIFNDTKVVEARIIFHKPTGGQIEIFCLEPPPGYGGVGQAMMQTGTVRWKCLIGGASKWKPGQVLVKSIGPLTLTAHYIDKIDGAFLIGFSWTPSSLTFAELLHQAGLIPLPPYIRRAPTAADSERYQTVYALHDGSVAAPTAGLHFTGAIFDSLAAKHISREFVTLHVGAGTFLPVKSATMAEHNMHLEYISVRGDTIRALLEHLGRSPEGVIPPIIPVGTTSARTIESLYWLGLKTIIDPGITRDQLVVNQWDAYELPAGPSAMAALESLLSWMGIRQMEQLITRTQLLITPGYQWRIAGALITNFHQPESTLLLLVASLIGEDWKKVYAHALNKGFRFLSYGDGCLLFPASSGH